MNVVFMLLLFIMVELVLGLVIRWLDLFFSFLFEMLVVLLFC